MVLKLVSAFVSLALGLIFIGSSSEEVFNELFSILMSRNVESKGKIFESPFFALYALGIGLLCLDKQKDNEFRNFSLNGIIFKRNERLFKNNVIIIFICR